MNKRNYRFIVLSVALALAALVALTACTPEELETWAKAQAPSESVVATRNASFPVSAARRPSWRRSRRMGQSPYAAWKESSR